MAKEKGWLGVLIESDCQDAIDLIKAEDEAENHPCGNLIEDYKNIIQETAPNIQHVLRKTNRCSDKMACLWKTQHERMVKVLIPPMELVGDLTTDLEGVTFPRGF